MPAGVCCTCLEEANADVQFHQLDSDPTGLNDILLRDKLIFCVPEFYELLEKNDEQACICSVCCQALCWGYCFRKMCLEVKTKLENNGVCCVKQETVDIDEGHVIKNEVFSDSETVENLNKEAALIEKACKTIPELVENNVTPNKFNCFVAIELFDEKQFKPTLRQTNDKRFSCNYCNRRFQKRLRLRAHVAKSHSNEIDYVPGKENKRKTTKGKNNKRKIRSFFVDLVTKRFANLTIRRRFLLKPNGTQRPMPKLVAESKRKRDKTEKKNSSMPLLFPATEPKKITQNQTELLIRKPRLTPPENPHHNQPAINKQNAPHAHFGIDTKIEFPVKIHHKNHTNQLFATKNASTMKHYIVELLRENGLKLPPDGAAYAPKATDGAALRKQSINDHTYSLLSKKRTKRCPECGCSVQTNELLELHMDNYHAGWWLSENTFRTHSDSETESVQSQDFESGSDVKEKTQQLLAVARQKTLNVKPRAQRALNTQREQQNNVDLQTTTSQLQSQRPVIVLESTEPIVGGVVQKVGQPPSFKNQLTINDFYPSATNHQFVQSDKVTTDGASVVKLSDAGDKEFYITQDGSLLQSSIDATKLFIQTTPPVLKENGRIEQQKSVIESVKTVETIAVTSPRNKHHQQSQEQQTILKPIVKELITTISTPFSNDIRPSTTLQNVVEGIENTQTLQTNQTQFLIGENSFTLTPIEDTKVAQTAVDGAKITPGVVEGARIATTIVEGTKIASLSSGMNNILIANPPCLENNGITTQTPQVQETVMAKSCDNIHATADGATIIMDLSDIVAQNRQFVEQQLERKIDEVEQIERVRVTVEGAAVADKGIGLSQTATSNEQTSMFLLVNSNIQKNTPASLQPIAMPSLNQTDHSKASFHASKNAENDIVFVALPTESERIDLQTNVENVKPVSTLTELNNITEIDQKKSLCESSRTLENVCEVKSEMSDDGKETEWNRGGVKRVADSGALSSPKRSKLVTSSPTSVSFCNEEFDRLCSFTKESPTSVIEEVSIVKTEDSDGDTNENTYDFDVVGNNDYSDSESTGQMENLRRSSRLAVKTVDEALIRKDRNKPPKKVKLTVKTEVGEAGEDSQLKLSRCEEKLVSETIKPIVNRQVRKGRGKKFHLTVRKGSRRSKKEIELKRLRLLEEARRLQEEEEARKAKRKRNRNPYHPTGPYTVITRRMKMKQQVEIQNESKPEDSNGSKDENESEPRDSNVVEKANESKSEESNVSKDENESEPEDSNEVEDENDGLCEFCAAAAHNIDEKIVNEVQEQLLETEKAVESKNGGDAIEELDGEIKQTELEKEKELVDGSLLVNSSSSLTTNENVGDTIEVEKEKELVDCSLMIDSSSSLTTNVIKSKENLLEEQMNQEMRENRNELKTPEREKEIEDSNSNSFINPSPDLTSEMMDFEETKLEQNVDPTESKQIPADNEKLTENIKDTNKRLYKKRGRITKTHLYDLSDEPHCRHCGIDLPKTLKYQKIHQENYHMLTNSNQPVNTYNTARWRSYCNAVTKTIALNATSMKIACPTCRVRFSEDYYNSAHRHICGRTLKQKITYKCEECNQIYETLRALKWHSMMHNCGQINSGGMVEETQKKIDEIVERMKVLQQYHCDKCEMWFDSKTVLRMHCVFKHGS